MTAWFVVSTFAVDLATVACVYECGAKFDDGSHKWIVLFKDRPGQDNTISVNKEIGMGIVNEIVRRAREPPLR